MEHSNLCMNCFSKLEEDSELTCYVCGWDNSKEQVAEALPYGTEIGGHYAVGRAKAMNGEGITYAAYDMVSNQAVELREFYPLSIAERNPVDNWIIPLAGYDSVYDNYMEQFIELAKNISRLKKVTVIHTVSDIVQQNQTVYVCYDNIPSMTLSRYIEKSGVLSWNTVNNLFTPVLSALGLVNSLGVPHLGISPENVRVTTEGNLLVTGFCIEDARKMGTALIEELYEGCAALEQYTPEAVCGEMTDVYAMAATIIYAVSGTLPAPAPEREKDGRLLIAREYLKDLPPNVVTALANALQVDTDHRTASFETLKTAMASAPKIVTQVGNPEAIRRLPTVETENKGLPPFVWLIITCAITVLALVAIVWFWLRDSDASLGNVTDNIFTSQLVSENVTPNMLGENLEYWQELLDDVNNEYTFTLKVSDRHFSDTVAEGAIISQDPQPDEPLPNDGVIVVTVSRGSATRILPEIRGMTFEELSLVLTDNGFVVEREDRPDANIVAGSVIGYKDQAEGDALDYGSAVTLIVSTGPEE